MGDGRRDTASETIRRRLTDLLGPDGRVDLDEEEGLAPAAGAGLVARLQANGVGFGRRHLIVVVIVALAGCGWAGYSMLSARTVSVAVTAVTPTAVTPTAAATPSPSVEPTLLVHVLGAVKRPGVVTLRPGARVQDAIAAAGGLLPDARPGELNLAAPVADGSQIVIGNRSDPGGQLRGDAGVGGGSGGAGGGVQIDLNAATAAELEALPGVGPVTAEAILAWRSAHGRFSRVEELQEVEGIGPKTFAKLAPLVTV